MATSREADDPYCLGDGEAATLLAGHPWRRFAVLGDSAAQGIGELVDGYSPLSWADRVAAELRSADRTDLAYRNFGERNLRAAQVRERQLDAAREFGPDLAAVMCGGNDAFDPRYDPDAVDREIGAIVTALRHAGAEVMTVSTFVLPNYTVVPAGLRAGVTKRLHVLGERVRAVGVELGTVHVHLTSHPASMDPSIQSSDGLHGNGRSHAIAAAEAVRALGAHLRKV